VSLGLEQPREEYEPEEISNSPAQKNRRETS